MKHLLKLEVILLFFIPFNKLSAQISMNTLHVIPEASVGYIFGVSFVWGFDVNVTSFDFNVSDQIASSSGIGFLIVDLNLEEVSSIVILSI